VTVTALILVDMLNHYEHEDADRSPRALQAPLQDLIARAQRQLQSVEEQRRNAVADALA
jgi:hypothetical protein